MASKQKTRDRNQDLAIDAAKKDVAEIKTTQEKQSKVDANQDASIVSLEQRTSKMEKTVEALNMDYSSTKVKYLDATKKTTKFSIIALAIASLAVVLAIIL